MKIRTAQNPTSHFSQLPNTGSRDELQYHHADQPSFKALLLSNEGLGELELPQRGVFKRRPPPPM